jgi:hypothetical protein
MEHNEQDGGASGRGAAEDIKSVIRNVIEEFVTAEKRQTEPAYKTELVEERRRREQLERRVNELVEENARNRRAAEESERFSQIRAELQRIGVSKVDLAFKVVKDEVARSEDGSLVGKTGGGEVPLREYLNSFVHENPEFLPARIPGGSGVTGPSKAAPVAAPVELEKIRPGMSAEEVQRVRDHIAQVALQSLRGE